uniref:Putative cadmium/zinc-transporting ATPase 3 n=1 Tax=Aegilops tauschii TaxID=37682 RepID=M8CTI6_AEGTA
MRRSGKLGKFSILRRRKVWWVEDEEDVPGDERRSPTPYSATKSHRPDGTKKVKGTKDGDNDLKEEFGAIVMARKEHAEEKKMLKLKEIEERSEVERRRAAAEARKVELEERKAATEEMKMVEDKSLKFMFMDTSTLNAKAKAGFSGSMSGMGGGSGSNMMSGIGGGFGGNMMSGMRGGFGGNMSGIGGVNEGASGGVRGNETSRQERVEKEVIDDDHTTVHNESLQVDLNVFVALFGLRNASVKVLNGAGLEASVRAYGSSGVIGRWPSPYIVACGALLLASSFRWLLPPLQWLALGAACAGAPPMLLRGLAAASRLTLDINILMLIAVAGAVALKDYAEAGVIVFLFTTAEWLETLACTKASAGMSSLMSMIPPKAVLAETGEVVNVRDIGVGAVIAVRAGEMVPVDGVVVDGQSEVDERSLTGESYPVPKQPQSEVWAGTLNLDGYIAVRTMALAENSTVAKMESLVEEAQQSKSKTQRLIDSCARLALVLLVSACPCALVLSTPVATFCALLTAARMGVLVKGGDVLESLGEIRAVAFDKTGTITRGEFSVDMFDVVGHKVQMSYLLYWISSIESKSSHPMAAALVEYAQSKSIEPKPECVAQFRILPGEGIYGEIDGKRIYVGNKRVLARGSSCQTVPERMNGLKGVSIGYVICDGDLVGVFSFSDDCRTGAAEAIRELASMGISSVLLTGDSAEAAVHAQQQLGGALEELHSELFPEDKGKHDDGVLGDGG